MTRSVETNSVAERAAADLTRPERFVREVVEPRRPLILRGLVRHWPVVAAGERSAQALQEYLSPFDTGAPVEVFLGAPTIAGKYFYKEDLSGFNFERRHMSLSQALELMVSTLSPAGSPSGYVGPIDNTIAGPPVSLAASAAADDQRFALFRQIENQALIAELRPGDALYLPKLWWHQVESTAAFNALVNYWWDAFRSGPDAPYTSLLLSMITIAERPLPERQAWKAFFDHYVFRSSGHPLAHLPATQHGVLGPLQPDNYRIIRARVMRLLRGG